MRLATLNHTARQTPSTVQEAQFWRDVLDRSARRLDAAREAMNAACAAGVELPGEAEMDRLNEALRVSRKSYRACIELLTGQSADDVEKRMCS